MWRVVVALIAAGCVQSGVVPCPGTDDLSCPEGTTCVAVTDDILCIPNGELDDCDDHAELDVCGTDRRCYAALDRLLCLPSGCGNAYLDPDEVCDDGGNISDDGCSADCRSNETCGNGVVDPVHGEQCDDSDIITHDGCSSSCRPEQPAWVDRTVAVPTGRRLHGMAFDTKRGRLVVFGGERRQLRTFVPIGDTWEWDGRAWTHAEVQIAPPARRSPAMAYDGSRGTVVMFGGGDFADTWEWNGSVWTPSDAFGPSGRALPAMVYDSSRKSIVMFGGSNNNPKPLGDTWEYRDAQWTQRVTATEPVLTEPQMAYDPVRNVIVMVGTTLGDASEVWELDATDWHRRGTTPALGGQMLAFDPTIRQVVLVASDSLTATEQQTWAWTGQSWTALGGPKAPRRFDARIATDAVNSRVILYGGNVGTVGSSDVWERDGNGWMFNSSSKALQTGIPSPGAGGNQLVGAAAVTDPRRGLALVFGGRPDVDGLTSSFDGATWTTLATTGPGSRFDHGLAFDVERDRAVLFGGVLPDLGAGSLVLAGDTWIWNGAAMTWTEYTGTPAPPARRDPAMAYDARRKRVVLFGGASSEDEPDPNQAAGVLADTWEWDGTAWTPILGVTSPAPRTGAAFAYDPVRERIVLFGGQSEFDMMNDTWTYDGAWHLESPVSSPVARGWAAMAWDAGRARLVLVGGAGSPYVNSFIGSATLDDAWEWDGITWRAVAVPVPITSRHDHVVFMSPRASGIDVLGGKVNNDGQVIPREPKLLELRWTARDTEETCTTRFDADRDGAVGCADQDCWPACRPLCAPGVLGCDALTPRCGDGTCDALESRAICPADCGMSPAVCGDLLCDPAEVCAGDCL